MLLLLLKLKLKEICNAGSKNYTAESTPTESNTDEGTLIYIGNH